MKPFAEDWRVFSRIALDSAVNSGKFQLLESKVQSKLADTYLQLETTEMYVREFFQLLPSGAGITRAPDIRRDELRGYISGTISKAKDLINESILLIDADLPKERSPQVQG